MKSHPDPAHSHPAHSHPAHSHPARPEATRPEPDRGNGPKPTSPSLNVAPDPAPPDPARPDHTPPPSALESPPDDPAAAARDRRQRRRDAVVVIDYPDELPISKYRDQLVGLISDHQVLIVCGETGSGKSTQLPKLCLEAGLGRDAMIGHTQPRRLAARSIADRLAQELQVPLGREVGYQVRFGDQTGPDTLVKLMTDGILLAQTQTDPDLRQYDAIIIDEAHERSLNIDFLLAYLRRLQTRRRDLKIIITSATIDAQRFAEHFADGDTPAPIITVEGRGYPVQIKYLPWEMVDGDGANQDASRHVIAALDLIRGDGDVLVFLPTERDIREVSHHVAGHFKRIGQAGRYDLLPLYARLPQSEQQRIFHPSGSQRRIIFATNVAESSLTVPGIRYVIDSGTARISRYSGRTRVQRLPVEGISRASADQRAGRCGRVGPGVCVRLYSAQDYDTREAFTTPEIRRTSLAAVLLRTKTLRLGPIEQFPLLDPPRPEAIREGIRTLAELAAIDDRHELTEIGWKLGRMPVDPRVGRILLAAHQYGVLAEVLPIAAAMEIPDPRDRPPGKQQAADEAHQRFVDPDSDFLSLLRLWRHYQTMREDHGSSKLTRILRQSYLSPTRMREWADVYRQLKEMIPQAIGGERSAASAKVPAIRFSDDPDQTLEPSLYDNVHKALLTGLLTGVAMAGEKNVYQGAHNLQLFLWPGSGVFATQPKWIVAAELVETTRQYARTVAKIQPRMIEEVGDHLIKRTHHDPHWSGKSNAAFCYQNLTLFGLPIAVRRRVPLAPIDPTTARDLLIEHGLVGGELTTHAGFVRHNRRLIDAIAELAAKTRRRDLVVDPYTVQQFYQARLPEDVHDRGRLEKYDRQTPPPPWAAGLTNAADVSRTLATPGSSGDPAASDPPPPTPYMHVGDLIESFASPITDDAFPDELSVGGSRLPLTYRFEPGGDKDGIAVRIHRAALPQISDDRLGWLVPGLLELKLTALIKSLPKRLRRNLVPAADVAAAVARQLAPRHGEVPFLPAVCEQFSRVAEMPITPEDFQSEKLEPFLQMVVEVVDDAGQEIATGRSVDQLQQRFGHDRATPAGDVPDQPEGDEDWHRSRMLTFDIPRLPAEVVRVRGGVRVAQYPSLADQSDHVRTQVFADLPSAEASLRRALTRLFAISERKELRSQVRWLPGIADAPIKLAPLLTNIKLENALVDLIARVALVEDQPLIREQHAFDQRRLTSGGRIAAATQEIAPWLSAMVNQYFEVRKELEASASVRSPRLDDIRGQVAWLGDTTLWPDVPWRWLKHYPRYYAAIAYRLSPTTGGNPARDAQSQATVTDLWTRWIESLPPARREPAAVAGEDLRWWIEELRVSLFAQSLGTSIKVSPQRCEKLL